MSEYTDILEKYPNVSFNDYEGNRDKDKYLFQLETLNICPNSYNLNIIKQYNGVYTWNPKLYDQLKSLNIKVKKYSCFPLFDNHAELNEFISYEEKEGICLICRYRPGSSLPGDIIEKRYEIFSQINTTIKHCYGKVPYLGEYYRGTIGNNAIETMPSSSAKLKLLNRYKFNLCFENNYHPIWSYNYLTEKLQDCFLSKTIAIYWGCYNIDEVVPCNLYINFGKFQNITQLNRYINTMSRSEYDYITENAYQWIKENRYKLGSIEELKNLLNEGF